VATRGLRNVRVVHGAVESAAEHLQPGERFDRAFLVTVLGEVPDRGAALRALHEVLRPGGVLSVTEFLPVPHYQSRRAVRRLAAEAGFVAAESYGNALAFTLNFRRSDQ
jgi:ubiquinone/menaquinone biosynthesis C-methylase UbiE